MTRLITPSRRGFMTAAAATAAAAPLAACNPVTASSIATQATAGVVSAVIAHFLLLWGQPGTTTQTGPAEPEVPQLPPSPIDHAHLVKGEGLKHIVEYRRGKKMLVKSQDTLVARGNGRLNFSVFLKPFEVPQELFGADGEFINVTYYLNPAGGGPPQAALTKPIRYEDLHDETNPIIIVDSAFDDDPPLIQPGIYLPSIEFSVGGSLGFERDKYRKGYKAAPVAVLDDDAMYAGINRGEWDLQRLSAEEPAQQKLDHLADIAEIMGSSRALLERVFA